MTPARTLLAICAIAAIGCTVAAVAGAAGGAPGPSAPTPVAATAGDAPEDDPLGADSIVVSVAVRDDGAAEWSIQYKYRLDTPNRTRGFERLRERIEAREEAYVADVREDVRRTVRIAENETDRSMAVRNVSVDSTRQHIPQDYGIVVHGFTWEGFADADDRTVRAGDAIRGFWLRPDTRLTIAWPSGYDAVEVEPTPDDLDDREATWQNPDFGSDEPAIVVERGSDASWSELAVPGLVLLTLLGTVVVIRRANPLSGARADAGGGRSEAAASATASTAADGGSDGARAIESSHGTADGRAVAAGADRTAGDAGRTAEGAAAAAERTGNGPSGAANGYGPGKSGDEHASSGDERAENEGERAATGDERTAGDGERTDGASDGTADANASEATDAPGPLTNEEQLQRVLERNDGRVKQQRIAAACDWSDSKTSRVVRSLEQEGVVEVFRIGRENVVTNAEVDVDAQ